MATGPTKQPNKYRDPKPKTLNKFNFGQGAPTPSSSSSDDDSSRSRTPPLPRGEHEGATAGYVRIDNDKVRISLCSISCGSEARELKRKLVGELEQVRNLRRRIEARGGDRCVDGYSVNRNGKREGNIGNDANAVGGSGVGKKVGTLARVSSEVSHVGPASGGEIWGSGGGVVGAGEVADKERKTVKGRPTKESGSTGGNKVKPIGKGKKDGGGGPVPGFGSGIDKYPKGLFKKCGDLLAKLMRHQYGWVFNAPVDAKKLKLHDYYIIIKNPMDLGTVKTRLTKNWYKSPKEFAEDVRLTFNNALTYNAKGQDVHFMAELLLKMFEQQWDEILQEYNSDERFEVDGDASQPMPASRTAPPGPAPASHHAHPHALPSARHLEKGSLDRSESLVKSKDFQSKANKSASNMGKTKFSEKPKPKDPIKKSMTFEEKQRLSTHLQCLPSDQLERVVQIIRKRNPDLFQQENEIEVDIDSFDSETLWELDNFVSNYMISSNKSTEVHASEAVHKNMQESYLMSNMRNVPKGAALGDVGSGASLNQMEKEDSLMSGSNGSNSSRSVSDSHSEDSDAGSSSGESDSGQ